MSPIIADEPVPLQADLDGVFRVGGTRVTLDSVIDAYQRGATADAIAERFPAVELGDVYAVIGWYLHHQEMADEYLGQRQAEAGWLRAEAERLLPVASQLRRKLAAGQDKSGH